MYEFANTMLRELEEGAKSSNGNSLETTAYLAARAILICGDQNLANRYLSIINSYKKQATAN